MSVPKRSGGRDRCGYSGFREVLVTKTKTETPCFNLWGHSGNHAGERTHEAKPLTFLWRHWNCLRWGETSIAAFRHHVPLHIIFSNKRFFANGEQNRLMSTPQEQNVDREKRRMWRIYIKFSGHKIPLFSLLLLLIYIVLPSPPPPPLPHFYCFRPPPPPHLLIFPPRQSIKTAKYYHKFIL